MSQNILIISYWAVFSVVVIEHKTITLVVVKNRQNMEKTLKKIIETRLKNAKTNACRVGENTCIGKMFLGKAELLESILEEYNNQAIEVMGCYVTNSKDKDKTQEGDEQRKEAFNTEVEQLSCDCPICGKEMESQLVKHHHCKKCNEHFTTT